MQPILLWYLNVLSQHGAKKCLFHLYQAHFFKNVYIMATQPRVPYVQMYICVNKPIIFVKFTGTLEA
jgi:hypothetical protein